MLHSRLIPVLLLHQGGLWKTEQFEPVTYVGDPTNAVRIFNDKKADELIVLDIDATAAGRGPDFALIERLASECFMPLCYGGGITDVEEARRLFGLGVEKVALNTAARTDPQLIVRIAEVAGRQAVVASIDVTHRGGRRQVYSHVLREPIGTDVTDLVRKYCEVGVGELLITSVDLDGTLSGPDLALARDVCDIADVPVIAVGGVRDLRDAADLVDSGAAVAAGAMFVYRGVHRAVLITYPDVEALRREQLATP